MYNCDNDFHISWLDGARSPTFHESSTSSTSVFTAMPSLGPSSNNDTETTITSSWNGKTMVPNDQHDFPTNTHSSSVKRQKTGHYYSSSAVSLQSIHEEVSLPDCTGTDFPCKTDDGWPQANTSSSVSSYYPLAGMANQAASGNNGSQIYHWMDDLFQGVCDSNTQILTGATGRDENEDTAPSCVSHVTSDSNNDVDDDPLSRAFEEEEDDELRSILLNLNKNEDPHTTINITKKEEHPTSWDPIKHLSSCRMSLDTPRVPYYDQPSPRRHASLQDTTATTAAAASKAAPESSADTSCTSSPATGGLDEVNLNNMNPFQIKIASRPILLTLTSFPFRIMHANDAFIELAKQRNVFGQPLYNLFGVPQDDPTISPPSLATCTTPFGILEEQGDIVRIKTPSSSSSSSSSQDVKQMGRSDSSTSIYCDDERTPPSSTTTTSCKIQIQPLYMVPHNVDSGIKYYGVVMEPMQVPQEGGPPDMVYLPMTCSSLLIVEQPFATGYSSFDNTPSSILAYTLRPMSHHDNGRVKWWRKKARENVLPPVLLWWFSGLDCYIVLDGHDRLLAAALEKRDVDILRLSRQTESKKVDEGIVVTLEGEASAILDQQFHEKMPLHTVHKQERVNVDVANRLLVEAYVPRLEQIPNNNT